MCEALKDFPRPMSVAAWHEQNTAAAKRDARRGTWDVQRCHCARDVTDYCCYCREFDEERTAMWLRQRQGGWLARVWDSLASRFSPAR